MNFNRKERFKKGILAFFSSRAGQAIFYIFLILKVVKSFFTFCLTLYLLYKNPEVVGVILKDVNDYFGSLNC